MLIFDLHTIGNKLLTIRKRMGMTQAEVAEAAGLSDRTYADIERGTVNMRTETILRICNVLHITPDEVLTEESTSLTAQQAELWERLNACNPKDKEPLFSFCKKENANKSLFPFLTIGRAVRTANGRPYILKCKLLLAPCPEGLGASIYVSHILYGFSTGHWDLKTCCATAIMSV